MNPAIAVLLVLSLAGLLWPDRAIGRAWLGIGLATMALLAPALVLSDGIVSPAGSLAELPPWQDTGDPLDGNRELRDVTFQVQPWLLYQRQEMLAGRFPWWNPYHYAGTPFFTNGSAGPLFPLHLLFVVLPPQIGFVLLPWLRLVFAGCGAFVLARRLGVSELGGILSALAFGLSGMLVSFSVYPMGNALMLVPWILWAVERWAAGESSWRWLAGLAALQLLAGHPESALHTCLLTAVYLLVRSGLDARLWLGWLAAWAIASLLAAVQIVPLALTLFESSRWLHFDAGGRAPLGLVGKELLRLVLPNLYGLPSRHDFWGPVGYVGTAAFVGVATLVLAPAALPAVRADRRWRGVAVLAAVSLLGAYHAPIFRDLLLTLPLVGRAPQHRLIFGLELTLALLAGYGFDRWRRDQASETVVGAGAVVALLATAWALMARGWQEHGQLAEQAGWTAAGVTIAVLLASASRLSASWRGWLALTLPLVVFAEVVIAHHAIHPGLSAARLYPTTESVRFLQDRRGRIAGIGGALHANAGMVYGLYDIRGDESIKIERYDRYYADLARAEPIYSLPVTHWRHAKLDRLGVRWVVAGPRQAPAIEGWRLAYKGYDARVYERPGALPVVRWQDSDRAAGLFVEERSPGRWTIRWTAHQARKIVVAETWDAGWRARVDGEAVEVEIFDELFIAVEVGPGEGRLQLRYLPDGLVWGGLISLVGVGLLIGLPIGLLRE